MDLDISACSCKDDSLGGKFSQNDGPGRRAALTHLRYQLHSKTKLMVLENVTTGSIHRITAEELSHNNVCDVRVTYAATDDSGYGGMRRYRGWTVALRRDAGRFLDEPQKAYDSFRKELVSKQVTIPNIYW